MTLVNDHLWHPSVNYYFLFIFSLCMGKREGEVISTCVWLSIRRGQMKMLHVPLDHSLPYSLEAGPLTEPS